MSKEPSKSKHANPAQPGIVNIAKTLGISPSTVSRALRAETAHLVNPRRRKQILEIIGRRNFSINAGARMLRRGVNTTLAVVVPHDENIFCSEFYGRLLAGILQSATLRGWHVQIRLFKSREGAAFAETMQHIGLDVSGIIYLSEPLSGDDIGQLRDYRRPLVIIKSALKRDIDIGGMRMQVVGVDNRGGAQTAVNFLAQLGHTRIGLLLGQPESRDASERKEGYITALRKSGLPVKKEWIIDGAFTIDSGRAGMEALLKRPKLPTAICCASDEIAFGAIGVLQAAGKRCPGDMSVVGFDDGFWATACRPALTTIRQPLADIAERAVCAIIEAARAPGKTQPATGSGLPTSLVIRDSTKVA